MATLLFVFAILVIAQLTPSGLVDLLVPIIVWAVTALMNKLTFIKNLPGLYILALVGLLNALVSWIMTLILPEMAFWPAFGLGFAATFIHEFIKKLTEPKPAAPVA